MPKCDTTGKSSTAKLEKLQAAEHRRKIRILRIIRTIHLIRKLLKLRTIRITPSIQAAAPAEATKVATMNHSTMVIDTLIHP